MKVTEFGKAVRIARLKANETLKTMATSLGISSAYLSAMETGAKNISPEWISKIEDFFAAKNIHLNNLTELAAISNGTVHLHDGLSQQQKMLIAGFASSPFNQEELKQFAELLKILNEDAKKRGK